MVHNPCCCGCSLQTGTKIIAVIEIIGSLFATLVAIIAVAATTFVFSVANTDFDGVNINSTWPGSWRENDFYEDTPENPFNHIKPNDVKEAVKERGILAQILVLFYLAWTILHLVAGIVLLIGAKQKSQRMCMIWLIVTVVLVVISLPGLGNSIFLGEIIEAFEWFGVAAWDLYFMWVVTAFLKEIKEEEDSPHRVVTYKHKP